MKALGLLLAFALTTFAIAQPAAESAEGAALKAEVDPLARAVYDAVNTREAQRVFALVRRSPVWVGAGQGAELNGSYRDRYARLVVLSRPESGSHAAEFYFVDGVLRFVFESAEYFQDGPIETGWKNFKGFPAWERRIWFAADGASHVESKGTPAQPAPEPTAVRAEAMKLLDILTARKSGS